MSFSQFWCLFKYSRSDVGVEGMNGSYTVKSEGFPSRCDMLRQVGHSASMQE